MPSPAIRHYPMAFQRRDPLLLMQPPMRMSSAQRRSVINLSGSTFHAKQHQVLTSFSRVVSRNIEKEEARQQQLNRFNRENEAQRSVYHRLLKWESTKYKGWKEYILSWAFLSYREAPSPHLEELKSLARHYYTPRAEIKCHICDFGEGKAQHNVIDLGQIEQHLITKPDWADVRWIHAPLGLGLMHSSIEDIFLHEGWEGRPFENSGRSGWPYLETEIFNFRHRRNFQEMRDVYLLLRDRKELQPDLDKSTWKADQNASLQHVSDIPYLSCAP